MRTRVRVFSGSEMKPLGLGHIIDEVDAYIIRAPDGSIRSLENAEEPPPEDVVQEIGGEVEQIHGIPKIELDDGTIVYGCQVWWSVYPDNGD